MAEQQLSKLDEGPWAAEPELWERALVELGRARQASQRLENQRVAEQLQH